MTTFNQTLQILKETNSKTAILLSGESGKGKSSCVKAIGLPVIDKRLSQMLEGDLLGIPSLNDKGETETSLPDWYLECCREPRVLFFDELNRAQPAVQQGVFEIILDRQLLGTGLHKDTKVVAAINEGGDYIVNEMDSALRRRFLTLEFEPTIKEFLSFAENKLDPIIVSFLKSNNSYIEQYEGHGVLPDRRKWEMLNDSPSLFTNVGFVKGLVGAAIANAFVNFVKEEEKSIKFLCSEVERTSLEEVTRNFKGRFSAVEMSQLIDQSIVKDRIGNLEFSLIVSLCSDNHILQLYNQSLLAEGTQRLRLDLAVAHLKENSPELFNKVRKISKGK